VSDGGFCQIGSHIGCGSWEFLSSNVYKMCFIAPEVKKHNITD